MRKLNRKSLKLAITGALIVATPATAGLFAPEYWNSKVWTTWQFHSFPVALGLLAKVRGKLNKENLKDSNMFKSMDCSTPEQKMYRQADGTCNDFKEPQMGSVGTRLGRNVKDLEKLRAKGYPSDEEVLYPNPLTISREILARPHTSKSDESYAKVPFLNMFAAAWIQFQVHDWLEHGNGNQLAAPYRVSVPESEARPGLDITSMILPKTEHDNGAPVGYPTYRNHVTPWWDAGQIYGNEFAMVSCAPADAAKTLRACPGAKLKLTNDGLLPVNSAGAEVTGFNKNWWVGLSALHTLFARNHNTIVDRLQREYPSMSDEALFQKARLVNAAIIAKIHSVEWTPGILPNKTLDFGLRSNWFGLEKARASSKSVQLGTVGPVEEYCLKKEISPTKRSLIRGTEKESISGEICSVIGGLLGGKVNQHGVPYSITEEFTSVYRLHSLLPEKLELLAGDSRLSGDIEGQSMAKVSLPDVREEKAHGVMTRFTAPKVMASLGLQMPGQLITGNYPTFLRNLDVKLPVIGQFAQLHLDMGAVDIMRDRERGVPRYNEFRRQLNLKPLKKFEDLMPQQAIKADPKNERFPGIAFEVTEEQAKANRELTAKLKKIYKNPKTGEPDLELVDLLVGTLAEGYRPNGYGFGETMFQVFILMASRRLQADRFYTDYYNADTYSAEGLKIIDEASFKSVLQANFPELRDVKIPQNAFLPWIPKYTDSSKTWSDFLTN